MKSRRRQELHTIWPSASARLSAFQAARHRVSTNRFNKVTGISMLSQPDRHIEKLGGDHKTRRTAAIASLKVGWCLLYQAAGWGRTTVLDFCVNPCAQTVTSE